MMLTLHISLSIVTISYKELQGKTDEAAKAKETLAALQKSN